MRNLLSMVLIAIAFATSAQISPVGRTDYKEWKYFPNDEIYINGSGLEGYTGWAAIEVDGVQGQDPIVYIYVCDLTEANVNRTLSFLKLHCPSCTPINSLTYMPYGYELYNAGDLYLAAALDKGYAVWNGTAFLEGDRAEISYTIKKDNSLLFIRFFE